MIAAPPVSAGEAHDKMTEPLPGVATRPVGAPARAAATTATPALLDPTPAIFTALTRYKYVVPFVSAVSLYKVPATLLATVVQVTPPSLDRSML